MSVQATMNTGDVSRRIGVPVTVELLQELGFKPVGQDKRAMLWNQADYPSMCNEIGDWIKGRHGVPMQPKPARTAKKTEPAAGNTTSTGAAFTNDDDF